MQVVLNWSPVTNALYYRIYRSVFMGGPYSLAGQSNPNPGQVPNNSQVTTTFTDGPGNLDNGTNYWYVISTITVDGESPYSAEISAPWLGAPAPPAQITVVIT